jgi:hypothetical protein
LLAGEISSALEFPSGQAVEVQMAERRSSKQLTLQDRLSAWAEKTREQADKLEPGPARDALLKEIKQAEKAARYDAWSRSSGLQPPIDPSGPSE